MRISGVFFSQGGWGWFYGIYITKSIFSFFIFLPVKEGVLYIIRVSGWRNWKDDPADISSKAFLELLFKNSSGVGLVTPIIRPV